MVVGVVGCGQGGCNPSIFFSSYAFSPYPFWGGSVLFG